MNIACPECSTVYRIDPARVPGEGIGARCRACGATFRVEADAPTTAGAVTTAAALEAPAAPEPAPPATPATPEAPTTEAPSTEPRGTEPPTPEPTPAPEPEPPRTAPVFGPQDPETRARRLARALVSDIKVYNPEKWERSRSEGTLRKAFRDEILKSWDEYVEQVGGEMAKKTPYFRDALNEILAGGESVF